MCVHITVVIITSTWIVRCLGRKRGNTKANTLIGSPHPFPLFPNLVTATQLRWYWHKFNCGVQTDSEMTQVSQCVPKMALSWARRWRAQNIDIGQRLGKEMLCHPIYEQKNRYLHEEQLPCPTGLSGLAVFWEETEFKKWKHFPSVFMVLFFFLSSL